MDFIMSTIVQISYMLELCNIFSSSLYVMLLCSKWLPTLILPLLNWNHTCDIRRGFETFRPAFIVNVKSVMAQNYTKLRISHLFSHTCCCEPDPGQIRCCDRCRCQIMFDCLIPLSRVSHCCCSPAKSWRGPGVGLLSYTATIIPLHTPLHRGNSGGL